MANSARAAVALPSAQWGLARSILWRAAQALVTVLAATVLVWSLLPLAPGDPALRILQAQGRPDPDPLHIAQVRQAMGLDRPLPLQYIAWLGRVARGDLSTSYRTGKPVLQELV